MIGSRNSICKILTVISVFALAGCGNGEQKDEKIQLPLFSESNNNIDSGSSNNNSSASMNVDEAEGPQYQQPTMDVLKGKPQLFPARYPVKRYPHASIAMVDVRPGRPPGYKNMVLMKTSDQMPSISQYYKQNLAAEGWKMVDAYANEAYESTRWVKGDQECEIRIAPDLRTPDKKYVQLLTGLRARKLNAH